MPDRLYFTDSDDANALIAQTRWRLLIGFAWINRSRSKRPSLVRWLCANAWVRLTRGLSPRPTSSRRSARSLRSTVSPDRWLRVCTTSRCTCRALRGRRVAHLDRSPDAEALRANIAALPGFGEMKIKALGAVLAKRFGVAAARGLVPPHPTLGDVDSAQALVEYQAAKRAHKAEWSQAKAK